MNKEHILKSNEDFQRIIKNNKPYKYKGYIIYKEDTQQDYRFGFSVGKKIGHAVTRNKIKRRLKSIVSKNNYYSGFNCIIIVSNNILKLSFQDMEKYLNEALLNLNLLEEK